MNNYYSDIHIDVEPNECGWILGKLMRVVHSQCMQGQPIAIALPKMSTFSTGNVLRLFSQFEVLSDLLKVESLVFLQRSSAIRFGAAQRTPETDTFARYIRERQLEKRTDTSRKKNKARLRLHLQKKGIEIDESTLSFVKRKSESNPSVCYIPLSSKTNLNPFSLTIRKEPVTEYRESTSFNSYGLSQNGSAVPVF